MIITQLYHCNQYVWWNNDVYHFQSYDTEIAIYDYYEEKLRLNEKYWNYSKTTLKHLYIFIEEYAYKCDWYPLFQKAKNKSKIIKSLIEKGYILTW